MKEYIVNLENGNTCSVYANSREEVKQIIRGVRQEKENREDIYAWFGINHDAIIPRMAI